MNLPGLCPPSGSLSCRTRDRSCQRRSKTGQDRPVENWTLLAVSRAHHLLAFALEAVAIALQDDDLGMVHKTVDYGCDRHGVAEDLGPCGESLVEAEDQRRALVARADQGENRAAASGSKGM